MYFKFLQRNTYFEWPTRRLVTPQMLPLCDEDRMRPGVIYEPIYSGKFVAYFPQEFGIESRWVTFVSDIHGNIINGYYNYRQITVIFKSTINDTLSRVLFDISENLSNHIDFTLKIEQLNSNGEDIGGILIDVSNIERINSIRSDHTNDTEETITIEMQLNIENVAFI